LSGVWLYGDLDLVCRRRNKAIYAEGLAWGTSPGKRRNIVKFELKSSSRRTLPATLEVLRADYGPARGRLLTVTHECQRVANAYRDADGPRPFRVPHFWSPVFRSSMRCSTSASTSTVHATR